MNYLSIDDIIVAKATGDGVGAVDIIRISGPELSGLFKILTKSILRIFAKVKKKYEKSYCNWWIRFYRQQSCKTFT